MPLKQVSFFTLSLISLFVVSPLLLAQPLAEEKSYFIMPEYEGPNLVQQCMRPHLPATSYWRITQRQLEILEQMLKKEISRLESTQASFIPEDLEQYNGQFVGLKMDGRSYYYGNFYPKEFKLKKSPERHAVNNCRGDKRFWGMLMSIDSLEITLTRNDRLATPLYITQPIEKPPGEGLGEDEEN